ncbi:BA14K family protein [Shinella sp. HZN7]|uniref:BA14K family protein n=1 Tax=Shinella sp. (strain HZN7) TaxID=879274 RepID=UPI00352B1F14
MMTFLNKCLAVTMSALFAATPVVPAGAMPLAVPKVQTTAAGGNDVQLVRDGERPFWLKRNFRFDGNSRDVRRNYNRMSTRERNRRIENFGNRDSGWRDNRRNRDRDVGWRDRGDRYGWYRGHRGYRYQRPGYRYHDGFWFPLAAFGVGTIIGGAIANDRTYVGGGSAHVNWCANRYRSYRAYDNTFQPYNGPRRQCISPYS